MILGNNLEQINIVTFIRDLLKVCTLLAVFIHSSNIQMWALVFMLLISFISSRMAILHSKHELSTMLCRRLDYPVTYTYNREKSNSLPCSALLYRFLTEFNNFPNQMLVVPITFLWIWRQNRSIPVTFCKSKSWIKFTYKTPILVHLHPILSIYI